MENENRLVVQMTDMSSANSKLLFSVVLIIVNMSLVKIICGRRTKLMQHYQVMLQKGLEIMMQKS